MTVGSSYISSDAFKQYASGSGPAKATYSKDDPKEFSVQLNQFQEKIAGSPKNTSSSSLVFLGRLTAHAPTVSHLLVQSPYKNECWDILANTVNADKPFTRIPDGEAIFMDPDTGEIMWGSETAGQTVSVPDLPVRDDETTVMPPLPDRPSLTAASLDAAAARYMGTAYERMDCYELVVAGLETMGIQYRGQEGLGRYLIDQAVGNGRALNHHLTGEGVTKAIGRDLHVVALESVPRVNAAVDQALNALSEKLAPGQILSFSTPTRGHTGVVSRRGGHLDIHQCRGHGQSGDRPARGQSRGGRIPGG